MSNDLISRSAVMEMLTNIELSCTSIPMIEAKTRLRDISTVYDVDKVERQIESKMFSAEVYNDDMDGVQIDNLLCMGDVHEIIREGGVSDNH